MFAYTYKDDDEEPVGQRKKIHRAWIWVGGTGVSSITHISTLVVFPLSSFSSLMCDDYDGKVNGRLDVTLLQCVEQSRSCICVLSSCRNIYTPSSTVKIHSSIHPSIRITFTSHPSYSQQKNQHATTRHKTDKGQVSQ